MTSLFKQTLPLILVTLLCLAEFPAPVESAIHKTEESQQVRLAGNVLPVLSMASPTGNPIADDAVMTLTIVLKRTNQAKFDAYLQDTYNPGSQNYLHFLTAKQVSDLFGPSQDAYNRVVEYLKAHGFTLTQGSENRLTITMNGTVAQAESTFGIQIAEYQIGQKTFFANDLNPSLPKNLAPKIQSIIGLNNLGQPHPTKQILYTVGAGICKLAYHPSSFAKTNPEYTTAVNNLETCKTTVRDITGYNGADTIAVDPPGWGALDGTGQKIGLVEFDTFQSTDIADYLNLIGAPATILNNLNEVKINGGAPVGPNQDEVLLDIVNILTITPAAKITVYDGPFSGPGTSFQSLFNAAINGGSTIISNSWAYCENQTTLADVQSIDSIFQTAAASGITVLNASGDTGSTCLNGSANTLSVPASSPNATAVGGSSLVSGPGNTYGTEEFWDGSSDTPQTGQGGFGVSNFFNRPSYQNGLTASLKRSVPDVVAQSDPAGGVFICQASAGGCPTGLLYGGTSGAAPIWAAMVAELNQALGQNIGALNPAMYSFANTSAFHNAASLGSDFAHVGLGSPNLNQLFLKIKNQTPGSVNGTISAIFPYFQAPIPFIGDFFADGQTGLYLNVWLMDSNGNPVPGKTVSLTANAGSQAVITPIQSVTSLDNGIAIFKVTDLIPETITLTATDLTDGIQLSQQQTAIALTPPAASAGIGANPLTVPANGSSTSIITVTLKDSLNRATPGKQVTLSQGAGHSVISAPNPSVTDVNGQIQFSATDLVTETVTYNAVDATDGNLPVPGSASVNFVNGSSYSCGGVLTPVAGATFKYSDFISGLPSLGFNGGCNGFGMAFDGAGNLFISAYGGISLPSRLYKFGSSGGTAGSENLLASYSNGTCASALSFSKDGQHLYMARQFCGSGGDVVEVNTTNGSVIRTVATGINCATGLGTDPISGDLFVTQPCPIGSGSANITRISSPESVNPTKSTYSSPGFSLGVNFTPDGTLWTESFDFGTNTRFFTKISPTNSQNPGTFTHYGTDPTNRASSTLPLLNPANPSQPSQLLVNTEVGAIRLLNTTTNPVSQTDVFTGGGYGTFIIGGPDGCAYASQPDRIVRITATDGSCNFAKSSPVPAISLSPGSVSPNPLQGATQSFTATLSNVNSPTNTPILFVVTGANPQSKMVPANSNGQASFSYRSAYTGTDTVFAVTNVNNSSLNSNAAKVTWNAGKHLTFTTLNASPSTGTTGQALTLIASLSDLSVNPAVAISGQQITFTLQGSQCNATTNASGVASCQIMPGQAGVTTLTATFAGTNSFVGSTDSKGFTVLGASVNHAPDAVNDNANTTPNTPVTISVLANDTDTDGDTLSVTSVTQPANGTAVKNANNTVTYTPNNGFNGTNTFNYTISDGHGGSDTATVTVIVSQTQCFKDDSNGNSLKLNLTTGEYFFRTSGGTVYHNFTVLTKVNNVVSFRSVNSDPNLLQGSIQQGTATAWIQVPRKGKTVYKINDSNVSNNGTCQ